MTIGSIINGKTTVFDLAINSLYLDQPKTFLNLYSLFVKAKTDNKVFTKYAFRRLNQRWLYPYPSARLNLRSRKLFRKSLAKYLKKARIL